MMNDEEQTKRGLWSSLMNNLYPAKCGESDTHFINEIEKNKISLMIQPKPSGVSLGLSSSLFIFEKNPVTGKVDLDYRSQKRNEKDQKRTFQNCTHFGITFDEVEGTMIELTSEFSDSSFHLGCNLKRSYNLGDIVNSINRLIKNVLNKDICRDQSQLIANRLNQRSCEYPNDLNQESCEQPLSSSVFPLLHILCSEPKDESFSGISNLRRSGSYGYRSPNKRNNRKFPLNQVSNHAESEVFVGSIMPAYATD